MFKQLYELLHKKTCLLQIFETTAADQLRITSISHVHLQTLTKLDLFKTFQIYLSEWLRSQDTHCLIFARSWAKQWLSSNCEKSNNTYLRVTAKPLQTLTKPPAVSKGSDQNCRRSCVHTRYPMSICFGRSWANITKFKMRKSELRITAKVK